MIQCVDAVAGEGVADLFTDALPEMADEEPFYTVVGFEEPHTPFRREYVPDEVYDRYDPETVEPLPHLSDEEEHLSDLADQNALITGTVEVLYDLESDPHERGDLLADGTTPDEHVEVHERLQSRLREWMTGTGDPLAAGHIPLPNDERAWFEDGERENT